MLETEVFRQLNDHFPGDVKQEFEPEFSDFSLALSVPHRSIAMFDFGFRNFPVEVKSMGSSSAQRQVHRLMAKARLLRHADPVNQAPRVINPILIVDGNITGPPYDRYRFVRPCDQRSCKLPYVGFWVPSRTNLPIVGTQLPDPAPRGV